MHANAANFDFSDKKPRQKGQKKESLPRWKRLLRRLHRTGSGNKFPYSDGPIRRSLNWLLSPKFQRALQITMGILFASLFTFVRQLRFPESCLGPIFAIIGLVLISPHPHIGCYLMAGSMTILIGAITPIYAGLIASLAYATGPGHYVGSIIAFGLVGLIPLTVLRATTGSPAPGMLSAVVYGITLIFSSPRPASLNVLWHTEVAYIMASMCLACASIVLAGTLVLPSLASHHFQRNISTALKSIGRRLSKISTFIVCTDDQRHVFRDMDEPSSHRAPHTDEEAEQVELSEPSLGRLRLKMRVPELWSTETEFIQSLKQRTDPKAPRYKYDMAKYAADIHYADIGRLLDDCKLLMKEAECEPIWCQKGRMVVSEWSEVLADTQDLLNKMGSLGLLVEGGRLFHSSLLAKECGFDLLPPIGIVLAELASVCCSLSEAIQHAGTDKAQELLTAVPWMEIKEDLAHITAIASKGYWERHADIASPPMPPTSDVLQTRGLLFLLIQIRGIIASVAKLEQSVPKALGKQECSQISRGLATSRDHRLGLLKHVGQNLGDGHSNSFGRTTQADNWKSTTSGVEEVPSNSDDDRTSTEASSKHFDSFGKENTAINNDDSHQNLGSDDRDNSGQGVDKQEGQGAVCEDTGTGNNSFTIHVKEEGSSKSKIPRPKLKDQLRFMKPLLEIALVIAVYKRVRPVLCEDLVRSLSSVAALKATLKDRRARYGFKFWLVVATALAIIISVEANYPNTKKWRLYYAYITCIVIQIEKAEAVVWKTVQRICGTLLGGTLAYLIVLRPDLNTRGIAVDSLVLTAIFVISTMLENSFKYTIYLMMITLSSLTFCTFGMVNSPGADFRLWSERVCNIIVACVFSASVSFLIFPWFASDAQLLQISTAYTAASEILEEINEGFAQACKQAAQDHQSKEKGDPFDGLSQRLENEVIQPIEGAYLSLQTEGVIWQKGYLATPRIVTRLVEDMKDLIHNLTALLMAVTLGPEDNVPFTCAIYHSYVVPLYEERKALFSQVAELAKACEPMLKHGPNAVDKKTVASILDKLATGRNEFRKHVASLRQGECAERASMSRSKAMHHRLTSSGLLRLGPIMVAFSHSFDTIMLIARVVIDDSYEDRETRFSALSATEGTRRHISQEELH